MANKTKECRSCKKTFDITYFHKLKANKDGRNNKCKSCVKLERECCVYMHPLNDKVYYFIYGTMQVHA